MFRYIAMQLDTILSGEGLLLVVLYAGIVSLLK